MKPTDSFMGDLRSYPNPSTKTNTNLEQANGMESVVAAVPARSRWTPKPEQILILESIFNSGMVNPPKDETIRIRKLLERFGAVADANVFYWFQNRRSRSRRRQRQLLMQATSAAAIPPHQQHQQNPSGGSGEGANLHEFNPVVGLAGVSVPSYSSCSAPGGTEGSSFLSGSSSVSITGTAGNTTTSDYLLGSGNCDDDLFSISSQMNFYSMRQKPNFSSSAAASSSQYQSELITVFINGVPSEIPRGPFSLKAIFGQDALLVHSSGEIVLADEYGMLFQGLIVGESYFLVRASSKRFSALSVRFL